MPENKTLDQILHDRDEAEKLTQYAETALGCSAEQAEILSRTLRHKFEWSGVRLLYKAENGEKVVAVDHVDQVREYLTRSHFDFLLPPKVAVENFPDASAIPSETLEAALTGSLTAKGAICRLLGDGKDGLARAELLLRTEKQKRESGGGADDKRHGITLAEMNGSGNHASNPFSRAAWNISKQGSTFKALGESKTAAMAAAVGARIGDVTWNKSHPANR